MAGDPRRSATLHSDLAMAEMVAETDAATGPGLRHRATLKRCDWEEHGSVMHGAGAWPAPLCRFLPTANPAPGQTRRTHSVRSIG